MVTTSNKQKKLSGGTIRHEQRPHLAYVQRVRRWLCYGEEIRVEKKE